MNTNDLLTFLKMSEIVRSQKPTHKDLVPFGLSKWLNYRMADVIGKIEDGAL